MGIHEDLQKALEDSMRTVHYFTPACIDLAIRFAVDAHAGQEDKQNQPYILHPLRVGARGRTGEEQIVGFLHDVIEDTKASPGAVRHAFGSDIADAVLAMSRGYRLAGGETIYFKAPFGVEVERETYEQFIERCALNPISRVVKQYDIEDNLSRIFGLPYEERESLRSRYNGALQYLREAQRKA